MPSFRIPLATVFGAIAFFLVLVVTEPVGPGLDPDSMSYVSAARSLVASGTLDVPDDDWSAPDSITPLAHFPPGFSAAIAVPLAMGMPALQAVRLVEAASAFVMLATLVWLVSGAAGLAAGAAAGVVLLATPALAVVHESALSEPLFLALLSVMLALMVCRPGRPVLAGLAAAAASLVRYAGVSAIGAVGLWWLLRRGSASERVRGAALAVLPGLLAQGAWVLRTIAVTHEKSSIRALSVYGQLAPTLREGAATVVTWLAPAVAGAWWRRGIAAVAVVALAALMVVAARRIRAKGAPLARAGALLAATGVTAGMYVAVVLASRLLADPGIPLDERILAPLMMLLETGAVTALAVEWRGWRAPARAAAAALVAAWCAGALSVEMDDARYALETGNDYADVAWSGSRLIAWVREHGAGRPLFTNYPTALYFHAGRMSRMLPAAPTPAEARAFADTVAARHGLIIAFDRSSEFNASPDSLLHLIPAVRVARAGDGAVYEVAGSGAAKPRLRDAGSATR